MPHIQQRLVDALVHREFCRTPAGPLRKVQSRIIFTTSEADFRKPYVSRLIVPLRDFLRGCQSSSFHPFVNGFQDIPLLAAYYRKFICTCPIRPYPLTTHCVRRILWEITPGTKTSLSSWPASVLVSHSRTADLLHQKERMEFEKMMVLLDLEDDFSLRKSTAVIEHQIFSASLPLAASNNSVQLAPLDSPSADSSLSGAALDPDPSVPDSVTYPQTAPQKT